MLTIEERVAFVEGRLMDQSALFSDIRFLLASLGGRLDHRCNQLDQRMDRLDQRVDRLDQRMDRLDQRMDRLDQRVDRLGERMDRRFDHMDARLDRLGGEQSTNFRWLVGIQLTTLVTVVAALLQILARP